MWLVLCCLEEFVFNTERMPGLDREIWILQYFLNTIHNKVGERGLDSLVLGLRSVELLTPANLCELESKRSAALQTEWLIQTLSKLDAPDEVFEEFLWCLEKISTDPETHTQEEANRFRELLEYLKDKKSRLDAYRSATEEGAGKRSTFASRKEYTEALGAEYSYRPVETTNKEPRDRKISETEELYEQYTRNFSQLRREITDLLNGFARRMDLSVNEEYDYTDDAVDLPPSTQQPSTPSQGRPAPNMSSQQRLLSDTSARLPPMPTQYLRTHSQPTQDVTTILPPSTRYPSTHSQQRPDLDARAIISSDDDLWSTTTTTDDDLQTSLSVSTTSLSNTSGSGSGTVLSSEEYYTPSSVHSGSSYGHTSSSETDSTCPIGNYTDGPAAETDDAYSWYGDNGLGSTEIYEDVQPNEYRPSHQSEHGPLSHDEYGCLPNVDYDSIPNDEYEPVPSATPTPSFVQLQHNISYCTSRSVHTADHDDTISLSDEEIYTCIDDYYNVDVPSHTEESLSSTDDCIYKDISPAALKGSRAAPAIKGSSTTESHTQKTQTTKDLQVTRAELQDLTDRKWVFSQLEQTKVKKLLADTNPGTFLVASTQTDSTFVLYAVNEHKRLARLTVTRKNGLYCINGGKQFTGLRELVRYYQRHRVKPDLQLRQPIHMDEGSLKKLPLTLESKSIIHAKHIVHKKRLAVLSGSHLYNGTYKGSKVVIKVATTEQAMKSGTNEALALSSLSHPNVVRLSGITLSGNLPTLILQHANYRTLREYLSSKSQDFIAVKASRIMLDICKAMEYLEKMKFVHCALNAENCLVQDDSGSTVVANFSLAHQMVDGHYIIPPDSPPLPPECQPPEVAHARWYSSMSDVWAFGTVIYELYSGCTQCPQFTSKTTTCVLPPKPSHMPDDVYNIVVRCWEYKQYRRPTFSELLNRLKRMK